MTAGCRSTAGTSSDPAALRGLGRLHRGRHPRRCDGGRRRRVRAGVRTRRGAHRGAARRRLQPAATLVGDLVSGEGIPEGAYDCVICTATLHLVYDIHAAARTLHGTLKPGGVALVTIPSLSRIAPEERDRWGDHWRVTSLAAARLFGDVFGPENVQIEPYGNLLAALGFLQGLAPEELAIWELEMRDPEFEVGIGVHARRATG